MTAGRGAGLGAEAGVRHRGAGGGEYCQWRLRCSSRSIGDCWAGSGAGSCGRGQVRGVEGVGQEVGVRYRVGVDPVPFLSAT